MLPKVGDKVQFTNDVFSVGSKRDRFKGKELEILKVILKTLSSSGSTYDIFFKGDGFLSREDGVDNNGCKVINGVSINMFEIYNLSSSTSDDNDDNRCKKCGAMGEKRGMSCVCPKCGEIVWGI
jgi:hypothetical protein